jgi:hypothetical protein
MAVETIARLRIDLDRFKPPIWRQVDVPVDASLHLLHKIIQDAMGWSDSHLYQFVAGERTWVVPYNPKSPRAANFDAKNIKLAYILDKGLKKFRYIYDLGDNWDHTVKIESVGPGEGGKDYPWLVNGKMRCPPEDDPEEEIDERPLDVAYRRSLIAAIAERRAKRRAEAAESAPAESGELVQNAEPVGSDGTQESVTSATKAAVAERTRVGDSKSGEADSQYDEESEQLSNDVSGFESDQSSRRFSRRRRARRICGATSQEESSKVAHTALQ